MADAAFRVTVEHNVVVAISRAQANAVPEGHATDDPLAVSTLLASNNKSNGCLDGDYFLKDFESARQFAVLCIGFQQSLCEKSLEAIMGAGHDGNDQWSNPYVPKAD